MLIMMSTKEKCIYVALDQTEYPAYILSMGTDLIEYKWDFNILMKRPKAVNNSIHLVTPVTLEKKSMCEHGSKRQQIIHLK